jgi:hypothetical protein
VVSIRSSLITASIGIFALLITIFTVSEAAAQCTCYTRHARHVAYRTRVRRTYHTARVRTVYRTVYVPRTRVASYVSYADDNYVAPSSRVVVTEPNYDAYATSTTYSSSYVDRIGYGWGHRDGFKDGWKAALKSRRYDVENNHDYHDANNGYRRQFGSKFLYKTSYREGYAKGYDAGYRSVTGESYGTRY